MITTPPKEVAAVLSLMNETDLAFYRRLESKANVWAVTVRRFEMSRSDVANAVHEYAQSAVALLEEFKQLSGEQRRIVAIWAARGLVEACYQCLPRGPVLFTIESYLGGSIRRMFANFIGEKVSAWLDGFIELEVAKLRKAKPHEA